MNSLLKLCLFQSFVLISCKYSANIPDFTPAYAKQILEFAKKYRYKIDYKHGIKLFRTNETLNVSSEYENSQAKEYHVTEVNSSYEMDNEDLSTAMSWMDDKTTPQNVEKMTLNISDYHFNIDKQFAHQIDYDFNDSFPVASQPYSDDGIEEPIFRNYFVKRNESYYLKDITELFSSYERQFLPTHAENFKWTYCPLKTTTRNFSKEHASNPYKRLFNAINTNVFEPYMEVGSDEVTRIDYPTTLTQYREPFFVYVHRLSETNVTFYHNKRKYYFRDGTMVRDLDGLKYFVPNFTYPMRRTRQTTSTIPSKRSRGTTKRKANVRSKLKSANKLEEKSNSTLEIRQNKSMSLNEQFKDSIQVKVDEELGNVNSTDFNKKSKYSNDTVYKFLLDRLQSLVTTEPSTTKQSTYIQPLFTVPSNKYAYIRMMEPDPNAVTFIVRVARNNTIIYIADKRSLDPNILASSVIYATNVRRNKEWERNFEHLNMNLFGRHRNHKLFTSTRPTRYTTVKKTTTRINYINCSVDSSLYIEIY
ncbi:uncharacterized protein LOC103505874 [Diaphorina citri]|uniref:Uncharacterized protein LOC103505874 n=1 Tax=Diaphorina citri TaxID=121845 RepID=A0A1S3CVC3_DIACI|nr:uncharacterized protein LOC103505874 [Diaphorina citri]KAI5703769.1 hypothetical protein M8J75_015943 [Diaphorina citri]